MFLTFYLQVVKGDSPLTTGLLFLPMIGCILISSNLSSIVPGPAGAARPDRGRHAAGRRRDGVPDPGHRDLQLRQRRAARPAHPGPGLRPDLRPGHQHRHGFGVAREDSGVASALVNTMQQVGGSIGTSALSTIALSATASYLIAHHTSPLAPAIAATHGYTIAFGVSAGLLGLGFILAIVLLPSEHRLADLRNAGAAPLAAPGPPPRPPRPRPPPAAQQPGIRSDSRCPVQLLAGSDPGSRIGGHAGPLTVTAGQVSRAGRLVEDPGHARQLHHDRVKYAPKPNRRDNPAGCLPVDRMPRTPPQWHRGYPPSDEHHHAARDGSAPYRRL